MSAPNLHTEPDVGSARKLMAPRASGEVLKPDGRRRSFSVRFRAYGKRWVIKLGRPEDGWTTQMAERELAVVLRDVDLGTWRPPEPDPAPAQNIDPTFHEFASDWFAAKELEVETNTANHYRNDLTSHLLPFFKGHHLSQITVAEVDRYRQQRVREAAEITAAAENGTPMMVSYVDRRGRRYRRRARPLSPRSINMQIDLLAQILAVAVDHGHIPGNQAVGKRRRLKASKSRPVHLDRPEQIALLLEAARRPCVRHLCRHPALPVQPPRGRRRRGGGPCEQTRGGPRSTAAAARDHPAQAAAHVRVDTRRDRQGPDPRDATARTHRPGFHPAGLCAHDAPRRGRARAAQSARRRPRLVTHRS
jgi:hypothetical protein